MSIISTYVQYVQYKLSMDWFKGTFTGKPHEIHGKINGFSHFMEMRGQSGPVSSEKHSKWRPVIGDLAIAMGVDHFSPYTTRIAR